MNSRRQPRSFDVTGLFGGIGGFELGLSQAGHQATTFCEIDPEASTILKRALPPSRAYARYPPHRRSGRRHFAAQRSPNRGISLRGLEPSRSCSRLRGRSLPVSYATHCAFSTSGPLADVLLENVPNWRSLHRGAYLDEVVTALEKRGYRWAYRTIDALAFGAPQRRLRIFLYATLEADPRDGLFQGQVTPATSEHPLSECAHGFYWTEGTRGLGWGEDCVPTLKGGSSVGVPSPPAVLLPRPWAPPDRPHRASSA